MKLKPQKSTDWIVRLELCYVYVNLDKTTCRVLLRTDSKHSNNSQVTHIPKQRCPLNTVYAPDILGDGHRLNLKNYADSSTPCPLRHQEMIWFSYYKWNYHSELIIYWKKVVLTHWGQVTHICVGYLTIIGSGSGLSPGRRQAIIWTNAGILLIGTLGTNFSEVLIKLHSFSFKKMHMKMSSGKWRPSCLGLNMLNTVIRVSAKHSMCISRYTTKAYDNNLWCTKRATYLLRCGPFGKDWNSQCFSHFDIIGKLYLLFVYSIGADSKFAPSQWETVLLCNDVSHWLGANLESGLQHCIYIVLTSIVIVISHTVIVLMWTNTLTSALLTSII